LILNSDARPEPKKDAEWTRKGQQSKANENDNASINGHVNYWNQKSSGQRI